MELYKTNIHFRKNDTEMNVADEQILRFSPAFAICFCAAMRKFLSISVSVKDTKHSSKLIALGGGVVSQAIAIHLCFDLVDDELFQL